MNQIKSFALYVIYQVIYKNNKTLTPYKYQCIYQEIIYKIIIIQKISKKKKRKQIGYTLY